MREFLYQNLLPLLMNGLYIHTVKYDVLSGQQLILCNENVPNVTFKPKLKHFSEYTLYMSVRRMNTKTK